MFAILNIYFFVAQWIELKVGGRWWLFQLNNDIKRGNIVLKIVVFKNDKYNNDYN